MRKRWLIAVLAVSVVGVMLIAAVIAYVLAGRGESVRPTDLKVGDCIKAPPGGLLPWSVRRVPCDRPHRGEVFAVLTMPDAPAYPDDQVMQSFQDNCNREMAKYAPAAPVGPTFDRHVMYPSEETWADGDRSFVCIATTDRERSASLR